MVPEPSIGLLLTLGGFVPLWVSRWPGGGCAVVEGHGAFEDIGVGGIVRRGRVRLRLAQQVAQLGEEKLVVGAFSRARLLPAGNEGGGIGGVLRRRIRFHDRGDVVGFHEFALKDFSKSPTTCMISSNEGTSPKNISSPMAA